MTKMRYLVTNCSAIDTSVGGFSHVTRNKSVVGFVALLSFSIAVASAGFTSSTPQYGHALFAASIPWLVWGGAFGSILGYVSFRNWLKARNNDQTDTPIPIRSLYFFAAATLLAYVLAVPTRAYFDTNYEPTWSWLVLEMAGVVVICEISAMFVVAVVVPRILAGIDDDKYQAIWGMPKRRAQLDGAMHGLVSGSKAEPRLIAIRGHGLARQDLMYLEAQGNYVNVVATDHNFLVRGPLGAVLDELQDVSGFQTHRSTWVAGHAFQRSEKKGSEMSVTLKNGVTVRVAKSRQKDVVDFLAGGV